MRRAIQEICEWRLKFSGGRRNNAGGGSSSGEYWSWVLRSPGLFGRVLR